jgi:LysM repeat protein
MAQLEQFVTQTAIAASGGSGETDTGAPVEGEAAAPGEGEATPVTGETEGQTTGGEAATPAESAAATPVEGEAAPTVTPVPAGSGDAASGSTGQASEATPYPPPGETSGTGAGAPPAQSDIVVPTATPGIPRTYTLKTGEWLTCIARRFNINQTELQNLNGLGNLVHAGTVLKIPQSGNPFIGPRVLQAHPTTYTVQSGDNIYSISCQFGDVSPEAIAYANQLSEPFRISVGQQLYIP